MQVVIQPWEEIGYEWDTYHNRPFQSFPEPLYQNEVKCSAFDMEMIFHSHANKTQFHKKGWAPGLILKLRVFGTRQKGLWREKRII